MPQCSKIRPAAICGAAFVLFASPAPAQPTDTSVDDAPQAVEVENAPTPTDLTELLGEGGVEAVNLDFYLHAVATNDNPALPKPEPTILHWRVRQVEGGLAFFAGREAMGGSRGSEEQVYSADGAFVSSQTETERNGSVSITTFVRDDDVIRRNTRSIIAGENPTVGDEETIPYRTIEEYAIPSAWFPLAFSYHLRAGHEAFEMRFSEGFDDSDWHMIGVMSCEDIGTESVDIGGNNFEAHAILITQTFEMVGDRPEGVQGNPADRPATEMLWYVLENGSVVSMRMEGEGFAMQADAITAEEAEILIESFE